MVEFTLGGKTFKVLDKDDIEARFKKEKEEFEEVEQRAIESYDKIEQVIYGTIKSLTQKVVQIEVNQGITALTPFGSRIPKGFTIDKTLTEFILDSPLGEYTINFNSGTGLRPGDEVRVHVYAFEVVEKSSGFKKLTCCLPRELESCEEAFRIEADGLVYEAVPSELPFKIWYSS